MLFKSLKEKCEYYRSLQDTRLMPNGYTIMMLDGRTFSKLVKNHYKKPFDETFMSMMNEVAKYLCKNISGAKFAYVQSDEISIFIRDKADSDPFMQSRTCKLLSIAAAMASGKFNQLVMENLISNATSLGEAQELIHKQKLAEFDCKVWNVPNANDAYAWFLYRQLDCIRNSKQQTAQTWLSHSTLMGKDADEQVRMLKEFNGQDWDTYPTEQKYGRLISRVEEEVEVPVEFQDRMGKTCIRNVWNVQPMLFLSTKDAEEKVTLRSELIKKMEE